MSIPNDTKVLNSTFILTGIPGLESVHFWIAFPMCSMYVVALLGNFILLIVIKNEPSLHQPMYLFLSMLAVIDIVISTATYPKILCLFWFHSVEIAHDPCFIQMFFIHGFSAVESGILLAMAFDRYVAICNPLRYTTILTNTVIVRIWSVAAVRGFGLMTPLTCLVKRLSYCGDNVIHHSYCEHMAVVKLACGDTSANYVYGITAATFVVGTDSIFIAVSYILILRSVFRLSSRAARQKAMSTCGSHISVILLFYTPALFSFYAQRFGHHVPAQVHILLADLYLLIPPMLNPIIYGIKSRKIRDRVVKMFISNQQFKDLFQPLSRAK
ncbi:olfactory receptor 52P1-like [Ambystoma mexicanum]|uniref:olfactory receptor 52P1-like n=1 Tax=Ambystoma mexicanum TaxID=8296 RepID=UPI0037E8DE8B